MSADNYPIVFPNDYTIFSFFSLYNFNIPDLKLLLLKINEKLSEFTNKFNISFSFSKFDLILEIVFRSVRVVLPILNKIIEEFKTNICPQDKTSIICYSNVFCKRLSSFPQQISDNQNNYNFSFSITSYTFINLKNPRNSFLKAFSDSLNKIIEENSDFENSFIELYWNMNIFQFIVKICGNQLYLIRDILFKLFAEIEKKIVINKTSSMFSLNSNFDDNFKNLFLKDEEVPKQTIRFMTYINLEDSSIKNKLYCTSMLPKIIEEELCSAIELKKILNNLGWYDLIIVGEAKNLYNIKKFLYQLKSYKYSNDLKILETVTNLLLSNMKND